MIEFLAGMFFGSRSENHYHIREEKSVPPADDTAWYRHAMRYRGEYLKTLSEHIALLKEHKELLDDNVKVRRFEDKKEHRRLIGESLSKQEKLRLKIRSLTRCEKIMTTKS